MLQMIVLQVIHKNILDLYTLLDINSIPDIPTLKDLIETESKEVIGIALEHLPVEAFLQFYVKYHRYDILGYAHVVKRCDTLITNPITVNLLRLIFPNCKLD